jgi:hypothetical protein
MRLLSCLVVLLIAFTTPLAAQATQVDEVATFAALRGYTGMATSVNVDGRAANNDGGGGHLSKMEQFLAVNVRFWVLMMMVSYS